MAQGIEEVLEEHADIAAALDRYAKDATGSPSRDELVMRIVRDWLITNGYLQSDPVEALTDDTEQMAP